MVEIYFIAHFLSSTTQQNISDFQRKSNILENVYVCFDLLKYNVNDA